jgi:hypothetical protein
VHLAHAAAAEATEQDVATEALRGSRRWRRHALAACLALACTTPAAAEAQVEGLLVVRADPAQRERAEAIAARIVDGALGEARPLRRPERAADEDVAEPWIASVLASAEERFVAFALTDAAVLLDAAVDRIEREGPASLSSAELVELWLWRARIAEALDDADGADAAARQALAIDPALAVDPTRHPPTLAARVERARGAMERCPFPLSVSPEGALVGLDGRPATRPPAEVPCGRHWLLLEAPGHRRTARAVLADAALPPEPVALALAPAAALALPSPPGAPVPTLWRDAARALDGELVLLDVAVEEERLSVRFDGTEVHAPIGAGPDEVLNLLRAARAPAQRGPDVGLAVGIGVGSAAAVALAVALAVVFGTPAPSGFTLRGTVEP